MSVVMKFGGTSVGSADAIAHVAEIVRARLAQKPVVVVSAVTKMTDALITLAHESKQGSTAKTLKHIVDTHRAVCDGLDIPFSILDTECKELETLMRSTQRTKKLDKQKLDHFQSFGERMCAKIVAARLNHIGVVAEAHPAWDIGMITNDVFGDAEPLPSSYKRIEKKLSSKQTVPVVTGFIGKTLAGKITTLGRGGSDFTASIIGAAIGAEKIQIWKEVDGILTTDPRLVPHAHIIRELAFEEASELAYFGAKVLHPKAIVPAMRRNIPVQVLNTFKPDEPGTTIVSSFKDRRHQSHTVEALTFKKRVTIIHILSPEFFDGSGLMARIFQIFQKHHTSIDVITTSVASVSVTIDDEEHLEAIQKELSTFSTVEIERDKAIVCAVGGSVNAAGVLGRMFTVLDKNNIAVEMISQASSGVSITFVVPDTDAETALKVLHQEYIG